MARTKGLLPLSGNFEPQVAGPFDARSRVETKADLLLTATWQAKDGNPYTYVGMVVSVYADATEGNNGIYRLKAADYTQEGNWEKAGAGATVDLNAIDTKLNTATEIQPVDVTPDKTLYLLGKWKISMANFISVISTQFQNIYAAINHNHTLASLSEKSYNSLSEKPTIPSIAGLMKEAEYTGTGTKQVNRAVSSQYAGQANADILGRTIHETYALKQSGVTPPETARVILDDQTPTYTIVALTAENLIVENNATTDGEIIAPVLAADKTLKISIIGNDTLLNGTSYADGVTIFAIYEAATETWSFSSILDPEVPDYSDMTVDIMLENPTVITSIRNGILVAQFIHLNKLVFIKTHATASVIGIYQCVGLYNVNAYLEPIAAGTALHTVRVKDGDVWYSQYDGKNAGTLVFESFDDKVDKNGTDRLITLEEAFLLENMSPIEFEVTDVINGIIIPESPTKLYRISTATDLTVSINTALLDLTKYIKLFVKVNINDWCTITWPSNFYFANLNYPVQVGEYMYEVSSSDGGETWRASQRYKNIASVGLDQEGNEIIGAKTLFVDGEKADNSGDGLTWLTAKKDVQAAIDIATIGDAVFVKGKLGGLKYLPTVERVTGNSRSKSFVMKSGVHLYGGFKGIETTLYEREMVSYLQIMRLPTGAYNMYIDLPKYRSILSGEIAGDSVKETVTAGSEFTNASIANNSYVVVWGDVAGNTAFNGFDVIGAFNDQLYHGGGIYGSQGLKVSNCEVYNNRRYYYINQTYGGVGIYNATVNNTIIRNNDSGKTSAYQIIGTGCLYCTISNSIIHSHVVRGHYSGGGQGTVNGGSILNSAVFNNIAPDNGVNTSGIQSATAINSVSYNNTSISVYGAGFHGCTATNCSAYNNSKAASSTAGSGFVGSTCINCTAYNNTAPLGAGFHNCSTCVNCAAYNNTATGNGGGFLSCTCINCVSIRNKAATGGGSYNSILRNTVVYGNKNSVGNKSNVYNDNASEETYSAFEDEIRSGTGNISLSVNNTGDANSPYFQSLSTESGVVDELYVSNPNINTDSALKNSGLDSLNTHSYGGLYDMMSNPRKVNTIDIGAYEIQ